MAGDGSTTPLDVTMLPDDFSDKTYGPFSHATGNGCLILGANTNIPIGDLFERPTVIDRVAYSVDGAPSVNTRPVRLCYALTGQTMAQAVSASQFVTSTFDLSFAPTGDPAAPGVQYETTVDRNNNYIPAGARLFLNASATTDTALIGFRLAIRGRTRLR